MNDILIPIGIISIITIAVVGYLMLMQSRQKKQIGIVSEDSSVSTPILADNILHSSTINLIGRPYEVLEQNGLSIPVAVINEMKNANKIQGHTMQLMAYCLLVEESYGTRPPGGILRYSDQEMKVAYTDEARRAVIDLVNEMTARKKSNQEFFCDHIEHNS